MDAGKERGVSPHQVAMETEQTTEAPPDGHKPEVREAIDWANAILSAPFLCALAKAQRAIKTVGKEGRNTEMGRDKTGKPGYDYAYSDDIIEALRDAFAPLGISFVHSWRCVNPPDLNLGEKQWLTATVVLSWGLLYGDENGHVGKLSGTAECDAVGSAGRPPDKAMAAAKTYCAGYLAMGLGAMNRGAVQEHEDVDRRQGDETSKPVRTSPRQSQQTTVADGPPSDPRWAPAKEAFDDAWRHYDIEHRQCTERPASFAEICDEMGRRYGFSKLPKYPSADLFERMTDYLRKATEGLEATRAAPPPDEANGKKRKETRA